LADRDDAAPARRGRSARAAVAPQQFRQFRDIRRDAPRLIGCQAIRPDAPAVVPAVDVSQRAISRIVDAPAALGAGGSGSG